ncbi:MAG: hypothetical protein HY287_17380 [Planctomycetes bacterium]|nr:hypothetical protein [Planctomycetota bacterium]MBI3836099.1 hypothetical protein [Planctomycetota bacterium]
MGSRWRFSSDRSLRLAVVVLANAAWSTAAAQLPSRALPGTYNAGATFTVTITLNAPGGLTVAGVQDRPPTGWAVSNISDSGSFDAQNGLVKWGPFFAPSVPGSVHYDVTAPSGSSSGKCFAGTVSFDGQDQTIGGDLCMAGPVPAIGIIGQSLLGAVIAISGVVVIRKRTLKL